MAATLLLLLLLVGATQATAPLACQGDPVSWCWDTAMATRCGWEQQCQDLWDSLALENVAEGGDVADGDGVAQGKERKCSLCTRVLKKIKELAGDNPDKAEVAAALRKGCQVLGWPLGNLCRWLVNKYQDKISEELQNGDMPRNICTALRICRS